MSGGSYDYLYADEVCRRAGDIEAMADRLDELGYSDLARETRMFLREPSNELREVWRAVEWLDSNDSNEVAAAVASYRAAPPLPEAV